MKMMVMMFLSAATLMLGPAVAKPTPYVPLDNLNVIINKIGNGAKSSGKETWVENLTGLSEKCNDKFFCKSFAILKKPENHRQGEEVILRNLKAYIVGTRANCTEKPERGNTAQEHDDKEPISHLWSKILKCARQVNLRPATAPTPEAQPPVDQPSA
ncbi:hypothetical protein CgunFtcFv8_003002 [Champsocephalus gunnari]|uniref:Uncharacterized protein n=2 Tax=Champsocephalus gunnari TaxID=52237 RepID=A0AAN8D8I0_CHAGU|nr:hypothetical protein CgunFtcFv8_003002 [Champsocephalus gunnari]